jgi:hypothetical protein
MTIVGDKIALPSLTVGGSENALDLGDLPPKTWVRDPIKLRPNWVREHGERRGQDLIRLVGPDVEHRSLLFGVAPHFIHFVHGDFAACGLFLAALGAALDFFALFLLAGLFFLALVEG